MSSKCNFKKTFIVCIYTLIKQFKIIKSGVQALKFLSGIRIFVCCKVGVWAASFILFPSILQRSSTLSSPLPVCTAHTNKTVFLLHTNTKGTPSIMPHVQGVCDVYAVKGKIQVNGVSLAKSFVGKRYELYGILLNHSYI